MVSQNIYRFWWFWLVSQNNVQILIGSELVNPKFMWIFIGLCCLQLLSVIYLCNDSFFKYGSFLCYISIEIFNYHFSVLSIIFHGAIFSKLTLKIVKTEEKNPQKHWIGAKFGSQQHTFKGAFYIRYWTSFQNLILWQFPWSASIVRHKFYHSILVQFNTNVSLNTPLPFCNQIY